MPAPARKIPEKPAGDVRLPPRARNQAREPRRRRHAPAPAQETREKGSPPRRGAGRRGERNEDEGEKNPVPKTKSRNNRVEYQARQPERPPASHISTRWRGVALPRSVAPAPEPGPSPDSRASVGGSIGSPPAAATSRVRDGSPPSRGRRKKDKGLHSRAIGRAGYRPIQAHTRCGHGVGRIGGLYARNGNRI